MKGRIAFLIIILSITFNPISNAAIIEYEQTLSTRYTHFNSSGLVYGFNLTTVGFTYDPTIHTFLSAVHSFNFRDDTHPHPYYESIDQIGYGGYSNIEMARLRLEGQTVYNSTNPSNDFDNRPFSFQVPDLSLLNDSSFTVEWNKSINKSYGPDYGDFYVDNPKFTVRVNVVPIPSAVWLLGSGLVGLVSLRRKLTK